MVVIGGNWFNGIDSEFPRTEVHGVGQLDTCETIQTSADCNWKNAYVSTQIESPYEGSFRSSPHHFIMMVRSGSAKFNYATPKKEKILSLFPGILVFLPAGTPLKLKLYKRIHTTHLYLRNSLLTDTAAEISPNNKSPVVLADGPVSDSLLEGLITAISEAVRYKLTPPAYVEHLTRALACYTLHRYSHPESHRPTTAHVADLNRREFIRFRALLDAQMSRKLSVADLAEGSGMTAGHFVRIFKTATGTTPYQYLLQKRLDHAKRLLSNTSQPVLEIALACGFADQVHFTKVFSKLVGMPPAAFRMQCAKR